MWSRLLDRTKRGSAVAVRETAGLSATGYLRALSATGHGTLASRSFKIG